jgi:5-methylcytosine-specific restriction endonuclease McrA
MRRKKLPENMRLAIYAEYDFKCAICFVDLKLVKPHIDHKIPISKGGADSLDNLQPLCERCNLKKGSKL